MLKRSKWLSALTVMAFAFPAVAWAEGQGSGQSTNQQRSNASASQGADASMEEQDSTEHSTAQSGKQQQGTQSSQGTAGGQDDGSQQGIGQELYALSNQQVRDLQRELQERGLYEGKIDGIPGPKTRAAVRDFQKQNQQGSNVGLAQTLSALGVESSSENQTASGRSQDVSSQRQNVSGQSLDQDALDQRQNASGSMESVQLSSLDSQQVSDLQKQLQAKGHYQGPIDGIAGPQTQSALQQYFNKQAQLAAQGQLGEAAQKVFGIEPSQIQRTSGREGMAPGRSGSESATQRGQNSSKGTSSSSIGQPSGASQGDTSSQKSMQRSSGSQPGTQ